MLKMSLSWTVGFGTNCVGGKQLCPDWSTVEHVLMSIRHNSGVATLSIFDRDEPGPIELQVRSERNSHLLTLGEENDDEYFVRAFNNPIESDDMIEILGDMWAVKQVCFDFDIVLKVFEDFLSTGDVSKTILTV